MNKIGIGIGIFAISVIVTIGQFIIIDTTI
jgi:hypothetical protein